MTQLGAKTPFVAIACGGTGGHLFPGLAVAGQLTRRGCNVALLVSPKEIDQQAVKAARDVEIFTLPAVGLQNRNYFSFAGSFVRSLFAARTIFRRHRPDAILAMGGFTSAPPMFVAKSLGAKTFLHESNFIPGRANRILARFVDEAFVGFSDAGSKLKTRKVTATGTPVRPQFQSGNPTACRTALGLDPHCPTIVVTGGSQGASGLNEMILSALPFLQEPGWLVRESLSARKHADKLSALQFLHLTGANDFEKVKAAYKMRGIKAVVTPFLPEMDQALGAATVAVSRSGASSLAEIAAMSLPSLLVPFPAAADNHQYYNALAFEKTGAATLLEQKNATPEKVAAILGKLIKNENTRSKMQFALAQWHSPRAAEQIADNILSAVSRSADSLSACLPRDVNARTSRPRSEAPKQKHICAA